MIPSLNWVPIGLRNHDRAELRHLRPEIAGDLLIAQGGDCYASRIKISQRRKVPASPRKSQVEFRRNYRKLIILQTVQCLQGQIE